MGSRLETLILGVALKSKGAYDTNVAFPYFAQSPFIFRSSYFQDNVINEVLAMLMVNSIDLLRLDLDGVHVLLPYLVVALEAILPERDLKILPTNVTKNELRLAGIKILVSMLALPSHFQNVQIKELLPGGSEREPITFGALKPRLFHLVINALQVEQEACNTHILLGGLMFLVQDTITLENLEKKLDDRQPQNPSAEFEKPIAGEFKQHKGGFICHFANLSQAQKE